ncbi:MAG: kynureninase [Phycisphaeraceae bacterium]|nr:kynureninase [Phycisphaeraceae bacterium]
MTIRTDEAYARELDAADPLSALRAEFDIPTRRALTGTGAGFSPEESTEPGDSPCIYLCGNSLGCMPRRAREAVIRQLDDWSMLGVEGHRHGRDPWLCFHERFRGPLSRLVGATEREVVAMNSLTANLHLLMMSFYRPTRERYRIVIEDSAFPSDSYAVCSQAEAHARYAGFDPASAVVRLTPAPGESSLKTQDVAREIDRLGGSVAMVLLGAVNYLTGQWLDMPGITSQCRSRGIGVGWDLAHAIGNVPMSLHDWGADFAVWCSYKYLNAGPGAVGGAFVHERHLADRTLPRLAGWWGNDPQTRFQMSKTFVPVERADAWSLSNPPILSMAPLIASLDLFDRARIGALRQKSLALTDYLERLVDRINAESRGGTIGLLTPRDPEARGCHLSMTLPGDADAAMLALRRAGIICDFREPNVFRFAPVPLYNTFTDVHRTAAALRAIVA